MLEETELAGIIKGECLSYVINHKSNLRKNYLCRCTIVATMERGVVFWIEMIRHCFRMHDSSAATTCMGAKLSYLTFPPKMHSCIHPIPPVSLFIHPN